ncbi:hypothetical protein Tco_1351021 [Tanacetum coccineum]
MKSAAVYKAQCGVRAILSFQVNGATWHAMTAATSACRSHVIPRGSTTSVDWVPHAYVAATSAADVAEGIITLVGNYAFLT